MRHYSIVSILRITLFHLSAGFVFTVGCEPITLLLFLILFFIRLFAIAGGYHRYFSHRSYKTSRVFQFILAFIGTTTGQKGPLSWATNHRKHHRHADTEADPHSPVIHGWFYAHIGWLMKKNALCTDKNIEVEFKQFPEVIFINRYHSVGFILYIGLLYLLGLSFEAVLPEAGITPMQLVVWCGIVNTLLILHATCLINSTGHKAGTKNAKTNDNSQNRLLLYPVTLGENWHNTHHQFPWSANTGLQKGQFDLIFYTIKFLEIMGLAWDLKDASSINKESFKH